MRRLTAWAFLGSLSLGLGWTIGDNAVRVSGLWLPLSLTAALAVILAITSVIFERDPLSPLLIMGVVIMVLYVLRPLYILSGGRWGPTRALDDQAVSAATVRTMTHASWLAASAVAAIGLGYAAASILRPHRPSEWRLISGRLSGTRLLYSRGAWLWGSIAALAGCVAYWRLIVETGGLSAYLNALSLRSGFFYGRAYLIAAALPLKIIALAIAALLLARSGLNRRTSATIVPLIALVAIGDFLTGGRAGLLLGTMLPLVILIHYVHRPLSLRAIAMLVAAAVVVLVASRVVTRDSVYRSETGTRMQLLVQSLQHLPETTVGGREAIPYDSLVALVTAAERGASRQHGRTYLPIATFPVPRAIWPNKPAGGGNVWFTQTYYPGYFAAGRTETSISMVGEAYANFGAVGVVGACFLFGVALASVYRRAIRSSNLRGIVLYAAVSGYLFTLVRGDAFHSVTWGAMTACLVFLLWPTVSRSAQIPPVPARLRQGEKLVEMAT